MICPQCREEGATSTVTDHGTETTCVGWYPYYDAAGIYHNHDPNRHTTHYQCSRGHRFQIRFKRSCPNCSYPNEVTP